MASKCKIDFDYHLRFNVILFVDIVILYLLAIHKGCEIYHVSFYNIQLNQWAQMSKLPHWVDNNPVNAIDLHQMLPEK